MTMPATHTYRNSVSNHQPLNWVESDRLERMLTDDLLALPNCGQKHKDIQRGLNKAPRTIASMLTDAFKKEPSVPKVTRLAHTILAYFAPQGCRPLKDLHSVETREEGDVNEIQIAIAQGDESTPTLRNFVEEVDELIAVLTEMRSAALSRIMQVSR